jgi:threonine aldolase
VLTVDQLPEPPERGFASDNAAGMHPIIAEAMMAANQGRALAYGDDAWTRACHDRFRSLFGAHCESFLVWGGTGGNVMALATMLRPAQAVVCSSWAHIHVDEAAAPERILGAKLLAVESPDGKIHPEQLDELVASSRGVHHAQPGVVSITQPTELGVVYQPDEVAALCDAAHRLGMLVHLDGARLANATAALGGTHDVLRSFTVDAGVDVVTFGATKGGLAYGEAVLYLNSSLAERAPYVRKQVTQLPSKMRFIAAPLLAYLDDDLWIDLGAHANDMARQLYERVATLPGLHFDRAPDVNSVYPLLPAAAIAPLQQWSFFWDWNLARHQVRWMTAWDTTASDIERFACGVETASALTAMN